MPVRCRHFAVTLLVLTAPAAVAATVRDEQADGRRGRLDSIGVATMLPDGTIVLDLRAEGPGGLIGDARLTYRPGEPRYSEIREHLSELKPGLTVLVRSFD